MTSPNHFDFHESHKKLFEILVEKTLKKHGVILNTTNLSPKDKKIIRETAQQIQMQAQRFLDNIFNQSVSADNSTSTEIIPSTDHTPSADTVENKMRYGGFRSPNNVHATKIFFKKKR
jgi:hypothetical protein